MTKSSGILSILFCGIRKRMSKLRLPHRTTHQHIAKHGSTFKLPAALLYVAMSSLIIGQAHAAPICSTGSDGTATITGSAVRVNVYFAAPDPAVSATLVTAGSTSIPIDSDLGPQASNLFPGISTDINTGDVLLIIQMMGADISTADNHLLTGDYGDGAGGLEQTGTLPDNFTVGQYEFVVATGPAVNGTISFEGGGLNGGLINEYSNSNELTATSGFRRYQVVKVPQFSNLIVEGEVVSDRWTGRWGGITAINVRENLDMAGGSFNADGRGFRGGQFYPGSTIAADGNFGYKGEGIAGMPQRLFSRVLLEEQPGTNGEEVGPAGYPGTNGGGPEGTAWTKDAGLGAPGNAGAGGGGEEDSGGGGGGNGGAGGSGGRGIVADTEGMGGAAFPQHFDATPTRLTMGGGGGSSNGDDIEQLDLTVSSGQAGGGIVFIRASSISASNGGIISANGDSGGTAPSEGGGGGGAGGTVLIHTDASTVDEVIFSAIGGKGGSSENPEDGGGGGGAGGVIWLSNTDVGSAAFNLLGGDLGTGISGGDYNGTAGENGFMSTIMPIASFDCNFVTLGIAKEATQITRVGDTGTVYDIDFSIVVENFSPIDAINLQVVDDLGSAFTGANITVTNGPDLGGLTSPVNAYDGVTQTELLSGTDTLMSGETRTITYSVRVDFNGVEGTYYSQASISSSQIADSFPQVLDVSHNGSDPDPDGDGDPTESVANGGSEENNEATPIVVDISVNPADCAFNPSPVIAGNELTATCTGVETGGSVEIDNMTCGTETGGTVTCTGTAGDGNNGSVPVNPNITTEDAYDNSVTVPAGNISVDSDGDGIPDSIDDDISNPCVPNPLAIGSGDCDVDGTLNEDEADAAAALDPCLPDNTVAACDSDGDGVPDGLDAFPNDPNESADTDGDGVGDNADPDDNNVCVPNPLAIGDGDCDNDGTQNQNEADAVAALDPCLPDNTVPACDSDGDGIPDGLDEFPNDPNEGNDADGDGIGANADPDDNNPCDPNPLAIGGGDCDNDGTLNQNEADAAAALDPCLPDNTVPACDSDGDGVPDGLDAFPNDPHESVDADGDGIGANVDPDDNNACEPRPLAVGTGDCDNDGTLNQDEANATAAIDPCDPDNTVPACDSDGDGVPDGLDAFPNDPNESVDADGDGVGANADSDDNNPCEPNPLAIGAGDCDADGTINQDEADAAAALDPCLPDNTVAACDTDGDGIPDGLDEFPNDPNEGSDADGDGIGANADPDDNDPCNPDPLAISTGDCDNDGTLNGDEEDAEAALDPCRPDDSLSACDSDGDGISNGREEELGLNPDSDDSDSDGIGDEFEIGDIESPRDTDADGIIDALDLDSDDDTIPDSLEGGNDSAGPVDTENDGLPDYIDRDSDNDGIPDAVEFAGQINPDNENELIGLDSDNDGVANFIDPDSDNDGIPDAVEDTTSVGFDTDGDGIDNGYDADSNGDGVIDDGALDVDADGIDDTAVPSNSDRADEANYLDIDSDNDGIADSAEAQSNGADSDADGIEDAYDVDQTGGSDANGDGIDDAINSLIPDTDGDGLPNHLDLDSDNDGLLDTAESGGTDTDNNGISDDGVIIYQTTGPNGGDSGKADPDNINLALGNADGNGDGVVDDSRDSDGDGIADAIDTAPFTFGNKSDSDLDTIADSLEGEVDTDRDGIPDYLDPDSDGDGILDSDEVGNSDAPHDSDSDGTPNYIDTDSDNDGISDGVENYGSGDYNNNGTPDRLEVDNAKVETAMNGNAGGSINHIFLVLVVLCGVCMGSKRRQNKF